MIVIFLNAISLPELGNHGLLLFLYFLNINFARIVKKTPSGLPSPKKIKKNSNFQLSFSYTCRSVKVKETSVLYYFIYQLEKRKINLALSKKHL